MAPSGSRRMISLLLDLAGLHFKLRLRSPRMELGADIERGDLCGVSTIGKVDFTDGEIGLDLSLSVPDGQLESTSPCLTKNRYVLTGSYSFKGQLAGQGVPEKVLQTLRGEFEFSARDGEFQPSPTVDTALGGHLPILE